MVKKKKPRFRADRKQVYVSSLCALTYLQRHPVSSNEKRGNAGDGREGVQKVYGSVKGTNKDTWSCGGTGNSLGYSSAPWRLTVYSKRKCTARGLTVQFLLRK